MPGGRGVLKQMRSLDKDSSISLVASMSSLPLASPSMPFKTHIPSTSRSPLPSCDLSGIRMSLAISDVSEPRTPLPASLLDPGWPGPSPYHAIIVGFPWAASGGPETCPTQLKKSDCPEEVTSAPQTTKQELARCCHSGMEGLTLLPALASPASPIRLPRACNSPGVWRMMG